MICNYFYIIKKFGVQTIVIKKKEKHSQKNCRNSALRNKIVIRFEMNGKKKFRQIISGCKKLQIQPYLVGNLVIKI